MTIDVEGFRLFLAIGFLLAGAHAHVKLSPYFASTWFGSGLVFAWFWGGRAPAVETLLMPALVFYVAAAVTKGLVENRPRLAGNHAAHVVIGGVCSGLVALPLLACATLLGAAAPGPTTGPAWLDEVPAAWLGYVPAPSLAAWIVAGTVFYGAYKILDHIGLGKPLQTVAIFAAAPFLPRVVRAVLG